MKKVSIIAPLLKDLSGLTDYEKNLLELFQDKYDFEMICYHKEDLPTELVADHHFVFTKVEKDVTFDQCITAGFDIANGDCIVVADLYNANYKEFIIKMLAEWEAKAQVVLIKHENSKNNFFQKICRFFRKIKDSIYDFIISNANLSRDYKAFRTFQLFTKEVANVIKQFPEKNYYLRNFDCWVDFRVSILYANEKVKTRNTAKFFDHDFIGAISSFVIYFGMLLLVLLTNGLVAENLRATYVIIGIALMVSSLVVALYCLFLWFVKRKTHLKQNKFK